MRTLALALPPSQIRFFLLQNRQGKTRLSKWYVAIEEEEMRKIESEVHRIVTSRDSKYTNFVEVRVADATPLCLPTPASSLIVDSIFVLDDLQCVWLCLHTLWQVTVVNSAKTPFLVSSLSLSAPQSALLLYVFPLRAPRLCACVFCFPPSNPLNCGALVPQYRQYKVIYRRYAGLFFSICVDVTDNELLYLESIHLFVELLDRYFGNVCELDLVFNFHKVYALLDEYILAGEIQEVSQGAILERMHDIEKIMF